MDTATCEKILQRGGPEINWPGEPHLGGYYGEEEIEVVLKTIRDSLNPVTGFGFICKEIEEFEAAIAAYHGTADAVTINGAGSGLDMAVMCLDLQPEDEVIVPSINFRAAAMAVIGQGGKLVLCEVDPKTLCADPADVEARMTPNTRAMLVTHMNGLHAPLDDYLEIAERHPHPKYGPPKFIGDAARAGGAGYKGYKVGHGAWLTVFSYHTMKLMTTLGEGGAVTVDDPEVAKRLRAIRQFGGDHWWGTNYKMTKVQAAVGLIQLRKLDKMIEERRAVAKARDKMLADVPELTLPYEPPECWHSYYLYTLLVPKHWAGAKRDRVMQIMKDDYNVDTVVANPPTHSTIPFIGEHSDVKSLPISEELGGRLFCIPIHPQMSQADNEYICAATTMAVRRVAGE